MRKINDRPPIGNLEYDVVLVGAGVGSMLASILLHRSGLRPIIVEKTGNVGGATAYSGGIVWAPCNHRMRAKGISDSVEEALSYLNSVSSRRGDPDIAQAYVDAVPKVLEVIEDITALRWATYPDLPDYYAEIAGGKAQGRYLLPHGDKIKHEIESAQLRWKEMALIRPAVHLAERREEWVWGRALVACLWARVLEIGIPFLMNHRVCSLSMQDGEVEGVIAEGPDGKIALRGGSGVLLNTGGFEWNEELTRRHVPGPHLHPQTPPASEGDGHIMAAEIGAAFALMDQTIGMPSIRVPGEMNDDRQLYRIFFQPLALPHSILVNSRGRRFANETFFVEVARAWERLDEQNRACNLPTFLIFDDSYKRQYGIPGGLTLGQEVQSHSQLKRLAEAIGIDPEGLEDQVARYNDQIKTGVDEFGRGATAYQRAFGDKLNQNSTTGPLDNPPYFAIQIHAATAGHRGGMIIDGRARVIDHRGAFIRGLFACGACAAGTLTGGTYFTGTAVGHALVFGSIAAEEFIRRSKAPSG